MNCSKRNWAERLAPPIPSGSLTLRANRHLSLRHPLKLDYEKVLISASDALRAIGFSVKQRDAATGSLSGEKYAMAKWSGPAPVHINVKVEKLESGTELRVQVVPPSGAHGSSRIPFDDFTYSLHNQIPDIAMVSVQGE